MPQFSKVTQKNLAGYAEKGHEKLKSHLDYSESTTSIDEARRYLQHQSANASWRALTLTSYHLANSEEEADDKNSGAKDNASYGWDPSPALCA